MALGVLVVLGTNVVMMVAGAAITHSASNGYARGPAHALERLV